MDEEISTPCQLLRISKQLRTTNDDTSTNQLARQISEVSGVLPSGSELMRPMPRAKAVPALADLLAYYAGESLLNPSARVRLRGLNLAKLLGALAENSEQDVASPPTQTRPQETDLIRTRTECLFAPKARLWTTRVLEDPGTGQDLRDLARMLSGFARATAREKVDGFVALYPDECGRDIESLAVLTNTVLRGLTNRDGFPRSFGSPGKPGWQFIHHGVRFYVLAFGHCYPADHSRFSFGSPHTMIMFQPDSAFKRVATENGRIAQSVRLKIRDKYADAGRAYDIAHVETRVEARSFVMPIGHAQPWVSWWDGGTVGGRS